MPSSLLNGSAWDRIADRVGHLPALPVARRAGFEFRLSDPEPAADFVVALGTGGELFSYYRDRGRAAVAGPAASLGRFLAEVSRRPGNWRWLRGVMLEYDIAAAPPGVRTAPGVFLGLKPGFRSGARLAGRPAGEMLAETLAEAAGWERDPEEIRAVASVVASIPEAADLIQIGAMPGRAPRLLRLTVCFARPEQLLEFLNPIEWPGSRAEVDLALTRVRDAAPSIYGVSLGVGARGLAQRLGLEIYRPKEEGALGTWTTTVWEDWRPVVSRLVAEGWCLPEKARGLCDLPGLHRIVARDGVRLLYFGVNHLKIDLGKGEVTAKAYAGMRFLPPASGQFRPE